MPPSCRALQDVDFGPNILAVREEGQRQALGHAAYRGVSLAAGEGPPGEALQGYLRRNVVKIRLVRAHTP
jgi:hypothetical protein